jgi:hypothetical protein
VGGRRWGPTVSTVIGGFGRPAPDGELGTPRLPFARAQAAIEQAAIGAIVPTVRSSGGGGAPPGAPRSPQSGFLARPLQSRILLRQPVGGIQPEDVASQLPDRPIQVIHAAPQFGRNRCLVAAALDSLQTDAETMEEPDGPRMEVARDPLSLGNQLQPTALGPVWLRSTPTPAPRWPAERPSERARRASRRVQTPPAGSGAERRPSSPLLHCRPATGARSKLPPLARPACHNAAAGVSVCRRNQAARRCRRGQLRRRRSPLRKAALTRRATHPLTARSRDPAPE